MLTYLAIIGLANLALGIGLAIYLRHSPNVDLFIPEFVLPGPVWRLLRRIGEALGHKYAEPVLPELPEFVSGDESRGFTSGAGLSVVADAELRNLIGRAGIANDQLIDGMLNLLARDSVKQRSQILEIERRAQHKLLTDSSESLSVLLKEFQQLNQTWAARLTAVAELLYDSLPQLGERQELGRKLDDLLFDQASLVHGLCRRPVTVPGNQERTECGYLLADICSLTETIHAFRDHVRHWLATTTNAEATDEQASQFDPVTGLYTAAAWERQIENWCQTTTRRDATARVAMVDFDRFHFVNARHGVGVGDRILEQLAIFVKRLADNEAKPTLVGQLSNQHFGIFLPEHSLAETTRFVEFVRQSLEATTIMLTEVDCSVTASFGVIEILGTATFDESTRRLQLAVAKAKNVGRNRTAVETQDEIVVQKPAKLSIRATVIKLDGGEFLQSAVGPTSLSGPSAVPMGELLLQSELMTFQSAG